MTHSLNKIFCCFLVIGCLAIIIPTSYSAVPIKNEYPRNYNKYLSKQEVAWMYTMKTRFWEDGTKIVVFYYNFDSPLHKRFCNEVLGITTERFDTIVNTYINKGNAGYFKKVETEEEMIREVSRQKGAIGYISNEIVLVNRGVAVERFVVGK